MGRLRVTYKDKHRYKGMHIAHGKPFFRPLAWDVIRHAIVCVLLLATARQTASATSQCLQWQVAGRSPSTTTDWMPSAPPACSAFVGLCAANPAGCGYNTVDYDFRNWSGNAVLNSWPSFYCNFTTQFKNKNPHAWPTDWTDHPDQALIGFRQDPVGCKVYVEVKAPPKSQCGRGCNSASDPINPANAATYSVETDLGGGVGQTGFQRFYNSVDSGNSSALSTGWRSSFRRSVQPRYGGTGYDGGYVGDADRSSLYTDEATACTSGFAQIKGQVSTWTNATASYANGVCTLSVGTTQIGTLPLLYQSPPTPNPSTQQLVGYDAVRDDGQVVSFGVNGTVINAPAGIGLRLQQTAGGFTLTDEADNIETYSANGALLTVTSRAGLVQTMGYDSSGRLSTVTDNFGHRLSLSYDSQGRLSSVTRP